MTTPLATQELAAQLRELAGRATPGPFTAQRYVVSNCDGIFADCACPADASLIAFLGTHVLEIAGQLERLAWLDSRLCSDEDGNFTIRFYAPCDPDASLEVAIDAAREEIRQRQELPHG